MQFPSSITPDLTTRAGRMLAAGQVRCTVTSKKTGVHLTILLKCIADNRERQYDSTITKKWVPCQLKDATHVFVEVPNQGDWNDKVGTFYPQTGRWYSDGTASSARVYGAAMVARWLNGEEFESPIVEESYCGKCGRTLSDPVSIERGIGPDCYGMMTGSQHEIKSGTNVPRADFAQKAQVAAHEQTSLNLRCTNGNTILQERERQEALRDESRTREFLGR